LREKSKKLIAFGKDGEDSMSFIRSVQAFFSPRGVLGS
jgi:hypothetical protein